MLIMRSMRGILRVIHDVTAVVVPLDRRRSGVFETHGALHAMHFCVLVRQADARAYSVMAPLENFFFEPTSGRFLDLS